MFEHYAIEKNFNPRSEYYHTWALFHYFSENGVDYKAHGAEFRAKTRKECIQYAEEHNISVKFIDSGRVPTYHW